MKNLDRKKVTITEHAMSRLKERVKTHSGYRSWEHLVQTARYNGKAETKMTDYEYEWVEKHIYGLYQSSKVRVFNGFAYLFMGNKGHARTLVTVIPMEAY